MPAAAINSERWARPIDLVMCDGMDSLSERAEAWAKDLPAASLPETSGYSASHQACMAHLLGATIDAWRGGAKESIARLLRQARAERLDGASNSNTSVQVLEQHGIKIYRDKRYGADAPWRIAISHTHPQLAKVFAGTDWKGLPGAPGAWAQMLGRMPGAIKQLDSGKPMRLRFDGHPDYCTALPWDSVLPPAKDEEGEDEMVSERDRE
jgi:hypothetical protein